MTIVTPGADRLPPPPARTAPTGAATPAAGRPSTLVVIPTYNERDNLPALTRALLPLPGLRVLVVDDRSPDGTGDLADDLAARHQGHIEVLHRAGPRGLGRSYADGLMRALDTGAPYIVQMDADLSHDPRDLPALTAAAAGSDLVIGSRYARGGRIDNWAWQRRLLSRFANRYVRSVTGLVPRDCTSGFRCWRREALTRVPLAQVTSTGYAFLVETLYEAMRQGLSVSEVPIVFVERRAGTSKLSAKVLAESAVVPWRVRLRAP